MRRREFILTLASSAAAWLPAARATAAEPPLVGALGSGSPKPYTNMIASFRRGLAETGYAEGQVMIEYRWAEGRYDRLPALAEDLVKRRSAVIFAFGGNGPAQAAKAATTEVPIVFLSGGAPVEAGLVASLARPGSNVTGVSWIATQLTAKRLELLHQLVPKVDLIGMLMNPDYPDSRLQIQELAEAAHAIGQKTKIAEARTREEIETALTRLVQSGADALLVANDPFFYGEVESIVALAKQHALPACYYEREYPAAGGLMSYGTSLAGAYHQAGIYIGRVLLGARPADLPVLQPTKFELVINLKTAKDLGLNVPPALFAQADEVIE
jgi:putative tryptophan/tyrosine transport system substrate-binding protein